jgi:Predicted dithiol-disulfide isomerase involved in polyketide biosynthesis
MQGHFWEMHDVLYREQAVWSKAPNTRELFESYAGTIGLNLDQFRKDMDSEKAKERVDSDHARGDSLGIKETPLCSSMTSRWSHGTKTLTGVRAAINAVLEAKPKSGA